MPCSSRLRCLPSRAENLEHYLCLGKNTPEEQCLPTDVQYTRFQHPSAWAIPSLQRRFDTGREGVCGVSLNHTEQRIRKSSCLQLEYCIITELTGFGSSQKVPYTLFIAAKLVMSDKKMLTLTTFFNEEPASSRTAERFLSACACEN